MIVGSLLNRALPFSQRDVHLLQSHAIERSRDAQVLRLLIAAQSGARFGGKRSGLLARIKPALGEYGLRLFDLIARGAEDGTAPAIAVIRVCASSIGVSAVAVIGVLRVRRDARDH